MIEWIKDNAAAIFVAFFGASGWLGFILNRLQEKKKDKMQIIQELRAEIKNLRSKLAKYEQAELLEKAIDKSQGTIYYEELDSSKKRTICGYCWEKSHLKIPVIPHLEYDEKTRLNEYWVRCPNCGNLCTFYNEDIE